MTIDPREMHFTEDEPELAFTVRPPRPDEILDDPMDEPMDELDDETAESS